MGLSVGPPVMDSYAFISGQVNSINKYLSSIRNLLTFSFLFGYMYYQLDEYLT